MNWRVGAGGLADLDALFGFATMTGGGFTNLPPDRDTLAAKLERSEAAFARPESPPEDEPYMLALKEVATGEVIGTEQISSRVAVRWPLYSYLRATLHPKQKHLSRPFLLLRFKIRRA